MHAQTEPTTAQIKNKLCLFIWPPLYMAFLFLLIEFFCYPVVTKSSRQSSFDLFVASAWVYLTFASPQNFPPKPTATIFPTIKNTHKLTLTPPASSQLGIVPPQLARHIARETPTAKKQQIKQRRVRERSQRPRRDDGVEKEVGTH